MGWKAGNQPSRQMSGSPGVLERETVNTQPTRKIVQTRAECKLSQKWIQWPGDEWVKDRGRDTAG